MIDVDKMHFELRKVNISVMGQRKLHRDHFEPDVRRFLHGNLACRSVKRLRGQGKRRQCVIGLKEHI